MHRLGQVQSVLLRLLRLSVFDTVSAMNSQLSIEKRKIGAASITASATVVLAIIFELVYLAIGTAPNTKFFAFVPSAISEMDMEMLASNIPGYVKSKSESIIPQGAITAVDAALQTDPMFVDEKPSILTDSEGLPSTISGADSVQWSVVDTNALKAAAAEIDAEKKRLADEIARKKAEKIAAEKAKLEKEANSEKSSKTNSVDSIKNRAPSEESLVPVG